MWIVALALRRPYTFIVMALVILLLTPLFILRTSIDIFPDINIPVISVIWNYNGLAPSDIANRIVTISERGIMTTVNDIEHIESQSVAGFGVIKVFFHQGANLSLALSQLTARSQVDLRGMPAGITPPQVLTYSASSTPVVQLGLGSKSLTEQQIFDLGQNFLRNSLATVHGAAMTTPYGGKMRQVQVDLSMIRLQAFHLAPTDIASAVSQQNLILPSGTVKIGPTEYNVEMNASPRSIAGLNELPVKTQKGSTIYMRDVAHVRDGFTPQFNIVRQDGVRGVLVAIYKNGKASILDIVNNVKKTVVIAQQSLPPELNIKALFDQSVFVRASIVGVVREGALAAFLTGLMILLFLGDWRPTLIIAISIPLSIFVSVILLSVIGETINIMTLGGLALAVGILVDCSVVVIENIERNLALGKDLLKAILDGASQIAVPIFVSTICICIVFIPMYFLTGVGRYLFVPLAEAVSIAILASYVLALTLIPTLAMYLMRGHQHKTAVPKSILGQFQRGFEQRFESFRNTYQRLLAITLEHRKAFALFFAAFCLFSMSIVFFLGQDFFPSVDAGLMRLHMRARPGMRVEETARLSDEVDQFLRKEIPPQELETISDNIGLPYSGVNMSYSTSGSIGSGDL